MAVRFKRRIGYRMNGDTSYLVPWVSFDLWKFKFSVIRIHAFDFFSCRGT